MPVDSAQLHAQAHVDEFGSTCQPAHCLAPDHQTAEYVQSMHGGEKVEERGRRAARDVLSGRIQLLPCHELATEKGKREHTSHEEPDLQSLLLPLSSCAPRTLQCDTGEDQY